MPKPIIVDEGEEGEEEEPLIISVEGFDVHISEKGRYVVVMEDGRAQAIPYEVYCQRLSQRLHEVAPTLDDFRTRWIDPRQRRMLMHQLVESGFSPSLVRAVDGLNEYDLFDVLGGLAFPIQRRTRRQREQAFRTQNAGWLEYMPPRTAKTLVAVAAQFARAGIEGLESTELFETAPVKKAGGLTALKEAGQPAELVRETKARLFT